MQETKPQETDNGIYTHEGHVLADIITLSKREYKTEWVELAKLLIREMKFR